MAINACFAVKPTKSPRLISLQRANASSTRLSLGQRIEASWMWNRLLATSCHCGTDGVSGRILSQWVRQIFYNAHLQSSRKNLCFPISKEIFFKVQYKIWNGKVKSNNQILLTADFWRWRTRKCIIEHQGSTWLMRNKWMHGSRRQSRRVTLLRKDKEMLEHLYLWGRKMTR